MVERDRSDLSVVRQCQLLSISQSTFYAPPSGESDENLAIMAEIDCLFLDTPFCGVRQMTWHLRARGWPVNVKRVRLLMRKMGLMPIYQRPKTSTPTPGHKIYPYLLRGLTIDSPNQVWCTDLTNIPPARGFLYLVAIMDWWSRTVLAWQLSNIMEAEFGIEAVDRHGKPEIFNSDQGSQFTSMAFTQTLEAAGIRNSIGGKGRWLDNVFVERLWRTLKYECVYLHAWAGGREARDGLVPG